MVKFKKTKKEKEESYDLFNPINVVCKDCIHSCKQLETVIVVRCPQRETSQTK